MKFAKKKVDKFKNIRKKLKKKKQEINKTFTFP